MKKLLFAVLLITMLPSLLNAQVTIQPAIPTVGLIQKNQLWNVLVINSSAKQYDCRLELVLRDRATEQEIMTASSAQFTLQPGSKQLNVNVVTPVQYNYILAGIDNKMQGLLPAGLYTACYSLVSTTLKEVDIAQECVQFDTEPLTPPMLIQPADSSILEVAPNQFSWIPPTPDGMFDRLQYEVIITEINEGQKANEAIEENLPFYTEGNHIINQLSYPSSNKTFEKNKWYAWQVVARDENNYAGKSEVWVFKVNNQQHIIDSTNESYIFINSNASEKSVFYIHNKELYIKYYSSSKAADAVFTIKTLEGNIVQQNKQSIISGDNFIKIGLSNSVAKGQSYKAEISDVNNKTYSILFSIID